MSCEKNWAEETLPRKTFSMTRVEHGAVFAELLHVCSKEQIMIKVNLENSGIGRLAPYVLDR